MEILNNTIGYIRKINNVLESKMNKAMFELDLTITQVQILAYLFKNQDKEIRQRDIEKSFNLTNPTVTGILNRLESKDFITRTVNSTDARYKDIHLSGKAFDTREKMLEMKKNAENEFLKNLSNEEKEQLKFLLGKAFKNISE